MFLHIYMILFARRVRRAVLLLLLYSYIYLLFYHFTFRERSHHMFNVDGIAIYQPKNWDISLWMGNIHVYIYINNWLVNTKWLYNNNSAMWQFLEANFCCLHRRHGSYSSIFNILSPWANIDHFTSLNLALIWMLKPPNFHVLHTHSQINTVNISESISSRSPWLIDLSELRFGNFWPSLGSKRSNSRQ